MPKSRARFAFLAEASALLSSSLDYNETLSRVANIIVPDLADWCTVDVLDERGEPQLLAIAHVDPHKVEWARELRALHPVDMEAPYGMPHVIRSGQAELYPEITDAMLVAAAKNETQLRLLREVGYSSAMVVPLQGPGKPIGALTLAAAESGRHYDESDLELAKSLGRHATLAIENARLYGRVQSLNEDLRQQALILEAANKELESFAYSVSHDLRSPLRAVDGFSRILADEYAACFDERGQHYLNQVSEGAQHMGRLIDDLLVFSRLSRQPLHKQRVAPAHLVHQVWDTLAPEREGREVSFSVAALPACLADPAMLRQVFANLLSNALKYTRKCAVARVEVGHLEGEQKPVYFVRDNGVGFDMRYAHKLFGVFQRLHLAEEYEGTGAGLAIVQRIIHRHDGRVWAESQLGEGATFYFTV